MYYRGKYPSFEVKSIQGGLTTCQCLVYSWKWQLIWIILCATTVWLQLWETDTKLFYILPCIAIAKFHESRHESQCSKIRPLQVWFTIQTNWISDKSTVLGYSTNGSANFNLKISTKQRLIGIHFMGSLQTMLLLFLITNTFDHPPIAYLRIITDEKNKRPKHGNFRQVKTTSGRKIPRLR